MKTSDQQAHPWVNTHTHTRLHTCTFILKYKYLNENSDHLGPIQVEILNKKGESMSRLPLAVNSKKLSVSLKVVWHCMLLLLYTVFMFSNTYCTTGVVF